MNEKSIYIKLKNDLYFIRKKINDLDDIHDELLSTMKEVLLIDNNVICNEEIYNNKKNIKFINNDIVNYVIPFINNKI
ncbi:MAG: hypothetical protein J6K21_00395 [Bacilli bacterium]|nr:hypothetical protein [Bacilli bacterium]